MSKAALGGFKNEDWVVSEFNNYKRSYWAKRWLVAMQHDPDRIGSLCAQTTRRMGFFNKADVLVLIDSQVEWISVKKFTASFNQIDKRWTDEYAKKWNIPPDVVKVLKMYCGEKGHRPEDLLGEAQLESVSDKRRFRMNEMPLAKRERVLSFLNENRRKIVKSVVGGSGRASARWMLIVEEENGGPRRSAIMPIGRVIRHCTGEAAITDRGNLKLGELTIQRKGGDSGKETAQMLQFKFSPRGLFGLQGIDIIEGNPSQSRGIDGTPRKTAPETRAR